MKWTLLFMLMVAFPMTAQQLQHKSGGTITDAAGKRLPSAEVKTILAPNPEALALFQKGKTKQQVGNLLLAAGIGGAVGLFATEFVADKPLTVLPLIGVGVAIAGISIKSGFSKKIKAGLDLHNRQVAHHSHTDPELTLCAGSSGIGLRLSL